MSCRPALTNLNATVPFVDRSVIVTVSEVDGAAGPLRNHRPLSDPALVI